MLQEMTNLATQIKEKGHQMKYLNIGGGLGINYYKLVILPNKNNILSLITSVSFVEISVESIGELRKHRQTAKNK